MQDHIEWIKEREKEFHDSHYDAPLQPVVVEELRRTRIQPCYTTGDFPDADNTCEFHKIINGEWKDKLVLDYACGNGTWAIYFAMLGAKRVMGFDLSEMAISKGRERVSTQGLEDKVQMDVMDAAQLDYDDNTFDIAIGHAVLHHVSKYPGIAEDLYRVMKPGARAYFKENLADFPLFWLWWKLKGEVPQGDIPIHARTIRRKFNMFSKVEIIGDDFLFCLKRFVWKKDMKRARRIILRGMKRVDVILFSLCPFLRKWGCRSYIILTK